MANRDDKRTYGSGEILTLPDGRQAIRWREPLPDGRTRKRYKTLGFVSRKKASEILIDKIGTAVPQEATPERILFRDLADRWVKHVLPTYKHSVQLGHGGIVRVHLTPKFGDRDIFEMTTSEIQEWVTELRERKYSQNSIDHFHEVLNAVMRTAMEWYKLPANPARGVRIGTIKALRKKWALTVEQARQIMARLAIKARAMMALAVVTGLRRGELEAVRWENLTDAGILTVREASYRGHVGDPKTEAGERIIPVPPEVLKVIWEWKRVSKRTKKPSTDFIFATREGKPENGNNILRRHIYPACDALGIGRANWLTMRRTFKRWCDDQRVSATDIAEMMGHADVKTQTIYATGSDSQKRAAVDDFGKQLGNIGQKLDSGSSLVN